MCPSPMINSLKCKMAIPKNGDSSIYTSQLNPVEILPCRELIQFLCFCLLVGGKERRH
jgi:hypothetical protein